MYHCFRPGKTWYDTDGKRIQAHGGSVLYAEGTFFWYGENKEGITGTATGEKCPFWHHGVRLYSSSDLYNWKDEGIIMHEQTDPDHPFYPQNIMDRPHILFHPKNKEYILWAKCSRGKHFENSFFAVCSAKDIRGPFRFCAEVSCEPFHAGDFDLIVEQDTAYILYENPHTSLICQTLTDDFKGLTEIKSEHIPMPFPPFVREAPAYFTHNGRKFVLTSGTTGYFPNASRVDEIFSFHGKWKKLPAPCRRNDGKNSFHAQFSSVFRHPHIPDLYIALGDRWLTDLPCRCPDMNAVFRRLFDKKSRPLPDRFDFSVYSDENTSVADYVWLPIRFDKRGNPFIEWRNEWTVEDFKNSDPKI